jgi:intracellular sulfur oxidation DsrE/DsrF family protein
MTFPGRQLPVQRGDSRNIGDPQGCRPTVWLEAHVPISNEPSSDRRSFLTSLATGSAALAAGAVATNFAAAEAHASTVVGSDLSEAWLNRLNGKHKQFFDATSVGSGFGLVFALNFLNSNNETYKLADSSLSAVVGLRHFAIPIGFTDGIWSKYKLGEFFQINDPATKAPATRNFFYHSKDGDLLFAGAAVEKLQARGVQVTVCNVALTVLSGMTSKNAGVSPEDARKEWIAGIIPGVVIVPSGVLAVNRAQEKGCTYCWGG